MKLAEQRAVTLLHHVAKDVWHDVLGGQEPALSTLHFFSNDVQLAPSGDRRDHGQLQHELVPFTVIRGEPLVVRNWPQAAAHPKANDVLGLFADAEFAE